MPFSVVFTDDAATDLEDLYDYVAVHDTAGKAERLLDRIEDALHTLSDNPRRGTHPPELRSVGIKEHREILFKPYRIIYRVLEGTVYVMIVTDGRRDMQSLLQRRLLRS